MLDYGSQPAKHQIDTANTDAHSLLVTAAVEENPATKSSIPLSNSGASSSVNLEPPPAAKRARSVNELLDGLQDFFDGIGGIKVAAELEHL